MKLLSLINAGSRLRNTAVTTLLFSIALNIVWLTDVRAQQAADEQAVSITRDQADTIIVELKAIHKLLESIDKKTRTKAKRPPPPPTARVPVRDGVVMGSADAPVTVVEFTDYQCPFCLRFVQNVFPKLKEKFIDTGKVKWVVRDMPLGFHKNALKASQAAHCAREQGKFWKMREVLFANSRSLEEENLPKYARVAGLDLAKFNTCLASERYLPSIKKSTQDAGSVKITGTPTFVIGKVVNGWVDGKRIVGARKYKVFEDALNDKLGTKPATRK